MPKVWIKFDYGFGEYYVVDNEPATGPTGVEIRMNAGLYRYIRDIEKKQEKLQQRLHEMYCEAAKTQGEGHD